MVVLSVRGPSLFPLFFRSLEFWVSRQNKKGGGERPTRPPTYISAYKWWLRLHTQPIFISHPYYIYKRYLTTIICCGCAYGCVHTTLRPLMSTELVEFCHKSGQVSADIWWWNEVIEAVDPTHIHLTSILYIYKVFDNLYMLWMCIWMCPHHVLPLMPTKLLEFCQKSGLLPGNNSWWNAVIEAAHSTHIHLTSILYI
jgi:hypothetical protein